jgi:hypothetical protein
MSLIPKSLTTLSVFYRLLIQPHRTNVLEVTEFCALAKLLKLFQTGQQFGQNKILKIRKI